MISTTITLKGQVTIPKKIRDNLNLHPKDQVVFLQRGDEIILKPLRDIFSLRGIISVNDEMNFSEMREKTKKKRTTRRVEEN